MSVAFRRESDEEHLEPSFELPIPPGPNLVTARGLKLIEAQVVALEARDVASLTEEEAKQHKRTLRYWRTRRATAQLMPAPHGDEAAFGARVTFTLNGRDRVIDIVGDDEADPHADRIAFSAPLARALLGGWTGDMIDFAGKAGAITIVAVGAAPDAS